MTVRVLLIRKIIFEICEINILIEVRNLKNPKLNLTTAIPFPEYISTSVCIRQIKKRRQNQIVVPLTLLFEIELRLRVVPFRVVLVGATSEIFALQNHRLEHCIKYFPISATACIEVSTDAPSQIPVVIVVPINYQL